MSGADKKASSGEGDQGNQSQELKGSTPIRSAMEVVKAAGSSDRPTRRMGYLFWIGILGVVILTAIALFRKRAAEVGAHSPQETQEVTKEQHAAPGHEVTSASNLQGSHYISLGRFTLDLKFPPGHQHVRGMLDLAEIEIVLKCDSVETCKWLEEKIPFARNEAMLTFSAIEKDDLMTKEGKQRLIKEVLERLNNWIPRGKVEDAFVTRLVIN